MLVEPRWGCGVGGACPLAPPTPEEGQIERETDQSECRTGGRGILLQSLSATVDQMSTEKITKTFWDGVTIIITRIISILRNTSFSN